MAGAAQAQEVYTTDEGVTYALEPIEGGAVLVNADDPADEITITQDCGARHPVLGDGNWGQDGGGFLVMFPEANIHFDGVLPFATPDCGG